MLPGQTLQGAPGVLRPFRNSRHWWLLISHKILRWLAPFFLLGMLAASLALLAMPSYRWAAVAQIAFYLLALAGWALQRRRRAPKLLYIAFYFCVVNVAALRSVCATRSFVPNPGTSSIGSEV